MTTRSSAVTGTEWGEWDALPGENPDDCLRSQNADNITQISNVITPGAITDGAITDGAITDGAIADGDDHRGRHHRGRHRLRRHHVRRGDPPTARPRCSSTARPPVRPTT